NRNMSLSEIFRMLADLTGIAAPRFRVPYACAWLGAAVMEGAARLSGRAPQVPLTAGRMARKRMYFSAAKAVREPGLPPAPVAPALGDAVRWFLERGYEPAPARPAGRPPVERPSSMPPGRRAS